MTDKQSEALRLADALLETVPKINDWNEAAAELRRLHEVNAELMEALRALFNDYKDLADSGDAGNWCLEEQPVGEQALAALAKAEGRL